MIYDGTAFTEFVDDALSPNTAYQYSVQAYYQQNFGKIITLPTVFTPKKGAPPIANAPWWDQ